VFLIGIFIILLFLSRLVFFVYFTDQVVLGSLPKFYMNSSFKKCIKFLLMIIATILADILYIQYSVTQ